MKKVKIFLPLLAFVFAVVAAFAFQPKASNLGTKEVFEGVANCPGITCSDQGDLTCSTSSAQIFEDEDCQIPELSFTKRP